MKVFSAYRHEERNQLGRLIGQWLDENRDVEVVETIVTQSSGSGFHCLTITLLCVVNGDLARDQEKSQIADSSIRASSTISSAPSVLSLDHEVVDNVRIRDAIDRLEGVRRDLGTVLSRVSSSVAREVVGEMNVERMQDAMIVLGAALEDLSHA